MDEQELPLTYAPTRALISLERGAGGWYQVTWSRNRPGDARKGWHSEVYTALDPVEAQDVVDAIVGAGLLRSYEA